MSNHLIPSFDCSSFDSNDDISSNSSSTEQHSRVSSSTISTGISSSSSASSSSSSFLTSHSHLLTSSTTRDSKRPREDPILETLLSSKKMRTSAAESSSTFPLDTSTTKNGGLLLDDLFASSTSLTSSDTFNHNNTDNVNTENNRKRLVTIDSKRVESLLDHPNWEGFDRNEVLTLILQSLSNLGYHTARQVLEFESGIQLEPTEIRVLHQQVLDGQWDDALQSIGQMSELSKNVKQWCGFIIMEQQFLELLHKGRNSQALERLQKFIVPFAQFDSRTRNRTKKLCGLLMLKQHKDLYRESLWQESLAKRNVWRQLSEFLPPNLSPHPTRLAALLHQAVRFQELQCREHGAIQAEGFAPPSLVNDHRCCPNRLPSNAIASLEGHKDEVWFVSISNDGKYIASGSADESVILWEVNLPEIRFVRQYHQYNDAISYISWSSDSQLLATSTVGGDIKVWDVTSDSDIPYGHTQAQPDSPRTQRSSSRQHLKPSTSVVVWVPNERQLLAAAANRRVLHFTFGRSSPKSTKLFRHPIEFLNCWLFRKAVEDIGVTPCGKYVVVSLSDKTVRILPLNVDPERNRDAFYQLVLEESDIVTSLCVSSLRNQFLVSVSEDRPVIRLWDISTGRVLQRYRGHQQGRFVLKASFGGRDENFVVSGSEDSRIFIWNRLYGSLVTTLSGHLSTVNSVHWPAGLDWMASASDDFRILVWHASDKPIQIPNVVLGKSNSASLQLIRDNSRSSQERVVAVDQ